MKKLLLIFLAFVIFILVFLFVGKTTPAKEITWGVNFSQKQAEQLGLNWKETYLALLEDLGAKQLKVAAHWDLLEPKDQEFFFKDLDWQMQEAQNHGAKVLLAIGIKTPRWPECHIPEWAENLSKEDLKVKVLVMLKTVVLRYKDHLALASWQVENEPLFLFGECPFRDFSFLQSEIKLVQSLDANHEVFTSDSGELSLWMDTARLGDNLAITLYRKIWSGELNTYISLPLSPIFYQRKAWVIEKLFGKDIIVGELQAEPWVSVELKDSPLKEQEKTMSLSQLQDNIAFARETGFDTFYLWGAEWWYQMKETYNREEFWQEIKKLFK